jgi:peptide/nickel transport system ATP-binding protein
VLESEKTIGQSVADPLLIHQLGHGGKAKPEAEAMLARVGFNARRGFFIIAILLSCLADSSNGIADARALIITRPSLVICDEPVSMLDATANASAATDARELKRDFDLTHLFITHA